MKMTNKALSVAILVALGAGSAHAVNISTTGTGQVLISPYYTTRDGNKTLMSVVNTTSDFKAIKVRFREGYNSREVLDFNVYMSPHDVWTASIEENDAGGASLHTNDTTCTVPAIPSAGIAFRPYAYNGQMTPTFNLDGGPTGIDRVKEGYFEVIEMGVDLEPWDSGDSGETNDALHVYNRAAYPEGVPENCAGIVARWQSGGDWVGNRFYQMAPPEGGLAGSAAVINVDAGTEFDIPLTALEDWSNTVQHFAPGNENPRIENVNPPATVVLTNGGASSAPLLYADTWPESRDALSAILQTVSVSNEYTLNPAVNGQTSWVVTFPTKRLHTDSNRTLSDVSDGVNALTSDDLSPFTSEFQVGWDGRACEDVTISVWNREEYQSVSEVDFSPTPGAPDSLCYEVNVINFNNSALSGGAVVSKIFGDSPLALDKELDDPLHRNGWARIMFSDGTGTHVLDGTEGFYQGLPAIGFRVSTVANGNVVSGGEAVLSNYAVSQEHIYNRVITPMATFTIENGDVVSDAALPVEGWHSGM